VVGSNTADNTYLGTDSRTVDVTRPPQRSTIATTVMMLTLVVGLLVASSGAVGLSTSPGAGAISTVDGTDLTAENETTPHENPDTISESGDSEQVASYLSGQLGDLLAGSTRNISQAEYDQARALLGGEYDEALSQYVTVAGETGQEDSADAFQTVQEDTAELSTLRQEFDDTRAEYEEAVDDGDTERARRLARELARLAEEIDGVTVRLDEELTIVENTTGNDLSGVEDDLETIRLSTAEIASTATRAELTETAITANATPAAFSFQNATRVTGTIHTSNGTALSNEDVTLQVGERRYDVETASDGQFSLLYRPVFLSVNTTTVPVQFSPEDTSPYLAANTTTSAQITQQTNTTITVSNSSLSGQYGTPLQVSGAVEVGDNGTAAGIPVELLLDGQQIGASETRADGQVMVTGDVPTRLNTGETDLQLRVPLTDTAVAGSETTTTAEITEAQTALSLETTVSGTDAPTANLTGTLQLAGGRPLGEQDLAVFVEGQQVDTVTTAADGSYRATIATADLDVESSSPTVRVAFTGSETHLAASDATATLELQAAVSDTSGGEGTVAPSWTDEFSLRQLGLVGVSILIVGLLFGLLVRTTDWNPGGLLGASDPADSERAAATSDRTDDPPHEPTRSYTRAQALLEQANEALAAGNTTTAVQMAYGSLRALLTADLDETDAATHWEFYDRCRESGIESLADTKSVISAYEIATFAPTSISTERAQDVLELVSDMIHQNNPSPATQTQPGSDD